MAMGPEESLHILSEARRRPEEPFPTVHSPSEDSRCADVGSIVAAEDLREVGTEEGGVVGLHSL